MFVRRTALALSNPLLRATFPVVHVRGYAATKKSPLHDQHHAEIEVGDLVTYTELGNKRTEGIVHKIYKEPKHNQQQAEIQNYYTKKIEHKEFSAIKSIARKYDDLGEKAKASVPLPGTTAATSQAHGTAATRGASTTSHAQGTTHAQATKPHAQPATSHTTGTTAQKHVATTQAAAAEAVAAARAQEQAQKIDQQVNSESSPLNVDFAPGDIVRFRVAKNFTAGVILELLYKPTHDEHGGFHGASKEEPMAKIENLWTKHINYHYLSVLEHVKSAKDVTPGRFAETEYAVYNNTNKK